MLSGRRAWRSSGPLPARTLSARARVGAAGGRGGCVALRTSTGRLRCTSASVATAQSKPLRLSAGLPTSRMEGRGWPSGRAACTAAGGRPSGKDVYAARLQGKHDGR